MDSRRITVLGESPAREGSVVYWMSRDQRSGDNWALIHAQNMALRKSRLLSVIFCLAPAFLGATAAHYRFMIDGLMEVEKGLARLGIPFKVLVGRPPESMLQHIADEKVGLLVTDFDPLREKRDWRAEVLREANCPFHMVDAHNAVPCWIASDKREYAAHTIRPKISRLLSVFLTEYPPMRSMGPRPSPENDWKRMQRLMHPSGEAWWMAPGQGAGMKAVETFIENGLALYPDQRSDPNLDGQSGLSPYLHFGQISAQRVALEVIGSGAPEASKKAFLEELIVRRELSDNYCYRCPDYDSIEGLPGWARRTLQEHASDTREYIYGYEELEGGSTHDDLWNAAQREMVSTGKMHGHMRMYWAKKILEWTGTPEEAMEFAIRLNNTYEMDGRDPNGYVGVAWSIGGLHDRPWKEREVFGKIRYMNRRGAERRFDVERYIERHLRAEGERQI